MKVFVYCQHATYTKKRRENKSAGTTDISSRGCVKGSPQDRTAAGR